MSTLINKVKEHISDNRGKYGAATGAGAIYGASKIDSPLLNQAGFNILAKGQNLALDAADKIDPRATTALNDLGMHKIRQEDIDASNALYNSGVAKYINPNPIDMVNANEHSTETYNKAMALKADAQDALVNAKNQGQDYLDQGINYVKGLNPFSESNISIPIKSMLLEGYQPEEITEGIKDNIVGALMLGAIGSGIGYDKAKDHFPNYAANNVNQHYVNEMNKTLEYEKNNPKVMFSNVGNLVTWGNGKLPEMTQNEYNKNGNLDLQKTKELVDKSGWVDNKIGHATAAGGVLGATLGGILGRRKIKKIITDTPKAISYISGGIGNKTAPSLLKAFKKHDAKIRLNTRKNNASTN